MKKIYIILFLLIIALFIITGGILIVKNLDSNKDTQHYVNIKNLKVLSRNNEYVLVLENENSELYTYSVYKNIEYTDYQKIFSLPNGESIESRLVCWDDNKIYTFGYNPASYNLSNGNLVNTGSLYKMLNDTTGRIDRITGIYDDYIYYEYSYNADYFYGKISLDLEEITSVEESDVPKQLR